MATRNPSPWSDEAFDALLGRVLQAGVLLSAVVVLCGGLVYLFRHGESLPHYHVFRGEPPDLRSVRGIVSDARSLSGRGLDSTRLAGPNRHADRSSGVLGRRFSQATRLDCTLG